MQETCILHQKHSHAHCDVITDEYITDKVQNQAGGGQYSFSSNSPLLVKNNYSMNTGI